MRTRLFLMTAMLAIAGSGTIGTAQAAVTGPAGFMQQAGQSLDPTEQVRRICRPVFRCGKFPRGCRWEKVCTITPDYPPEHRRR